ncbi:MAG: peptidylprolyl isomerase [Fimbriimonadaceae bacterium]
MLTSLALFVAMLPIAPTASPSMGGEGVQAITSYAPGGPKVEVMMEKGGTFTIRMDPASSYRTVRHLVGLVEKGFYDGQRVHRVERWVTQWGDPLSRDAPMSDPKMGDGGSGKDVPFEESPVEFVRGVVGVASWGKKKGGDSQLFILKKDAWRLKGNYAAVGFVIRGMDVVDKVQRGDRIKSIRIVK